MHASRANIVWAQGWPFLSLFLLAGPILRRASVLEWVLALSGVAAFIAISLVLRRATGGATFALAAASATLGVAFASFNPGSAACFLMAAAAIGSSKRRAVARPLVVTYVVVVATYAALTGLAPFFWIPTVLGAGIVGAVSLAFAELNDVVEDQHVAREYADRVARDSERERISRDLHDILGHTLSIVALKSELASRVIETDHRRAEDEIADVAGVARQTLSEMRIAIAGFRAVDPAAEVARACTLLEDSGIRATADVADVDLTREQEVAVAMAIREAVTNVLRHASGASKCTLCLAQSDGACTFEIQDDGAGGSAAEGFGLSGMRERVEGLGGTVNVDRTHGMHLRIVIPTD